VFFKPVFEKTPPYTFNIGIFIRLFNRKFSGKNFLTWNVALFYALFWEIRSETVCKNTRRLSLIKRRDYMLKLRAIRNEGNVPDFPTSLVKRFTVRIGSTMVVNANLYRSVQGCGFCFVNGKGYGSPCSIDTSVMVIAGRGTNLILGPLGSRGTSCR
jgi:hypothetical protein